MSVVSVEVHEDIAFLYVDNPPVNAISHGVRQGIVEGLATALSNNTVEVIILTAKGRTFMAGADISEFEKGPQPPHLGDVVDALEAADKPVIAALHGFALGGGLELASGCHYRIANAGTKIGFPEVNLGIIPGARGAQRLPRLIGVKAALDLITSGKQISAENALSLGILDRVCEGDLMEQAVSFARELVGQGKGARRISEIMIDPGSFPAGLFDETRKALAKKMRGFEAPQAAVDAVEAALLPYTQGTAREREISLERRASPQSSAQQHLFFAERACGRIPNIPKDTARRPIKKVGIIGAGTMGGGIAMAFSSAGFDVTLLEIAEDALAKGLARIAQNYGGNVKRGRITQAQADDCIGRINGTTEYADLEHMDLVIEAVFEKMEVKKQVFETLDKVVKPGAILATNTSYLDVNEIAAATKRPQDVIGLHFFSPANIMKLLEIVRGDKTAPDVLSTATALAKRIGKVGVVSGVCFGFIGNRMLQGYAREAGLMLLEGAAPQQIDQALYDFGMPMGPIAVTDMAGIDIGYMIRQALDPSQYDVNAFAVHDRLVEMGRKGQKTGAGFYRYETGNRAPIPDPEVDAIIGQESQARGVKQRSISDAEIVERCIFALVNIGAQILDEGIAYRPGDIDVVYANGYGFPRYRGGPMHYADFVGLAKTHEIICSLREQHGDRWWSPAPLIEKLARQGGSFKSLG